MGTVTGRQGTGAGEEAEGCQPRQEDLSRLRCHFPGVCTSQRCLFAPGRKKPQALALTQQDQGLHPFLALLSRVQGDGGVETSCTFFDGAPSPFFAFACLFPGTATVEKLEDFINNINSVLESLYIEIKKGVTEDDGRPIYALVSADRAPWWTCEGPRWRQPRALLTGANAGAPASPRAWREKGIRCLFI